MKRKRYTMPLAFSYVRFSHPDQGKGDSLRRQTQGAEQWCKRNGAELDKSLTLHDLGVSSFHGQNAAIGNFRTFLEAIGTNRVPPGSILIVENFNRISRQGIDEGYDLIKKILKAGIRIVTLSPERNFDIEATQKLTKGALEIQLILERAAEESEIKSKRVGDAWANKRKAAADGKPTTMHLPAWIKSEGNRLTLDPERTATLRKVFGLAYEGLGVSRIAQQLNKEQIPVIGRKVFKGKPVVWSESIVYALLSARTVMGEYQPCTGRGGRGSRIAVGNPIANFYPQAIEPDEFHSVQGLLKSRKKNGNGRRGRHVNLFAGLLRDAFQPTSTYTYAHGGQRRRPTLIPVGFKTGRGGPGVWTCYPAAPFEAAIVKMLREVRVKDLTGGDAQRHVEALARQTEEVAEARRKWFAKMDDPRIVETVAEKLAELTDRHKKLSKELADAQREAACPLSESLGEFQGCAKALEADPSEEKREKVQAALRRSIHHVYCIFTGAGRLRLAAVQVQFRGSDQHRDYLIGYDPGRSNGRIQRDGEYRVKAFPKRDAGPLNFAEAAGAKRRRRF